MKKILHISKFYEPHKGGIEDVCRTIVNVIRERGINYEQTVLCFNDNNTNREDVIDNIKVHRASVLFEFASQSISTSYYFILRKLLKEYKPDYIHYHAPNPFVAFLLLLFKHKNTKLIVHWHSDIVAQKILYKFINPIESILLKRSDKIIATSPNYIDDSIPLTKHKNKVVVLPNVINSDKFEFTEEVNYKAIGIRNDYENKPIVLFIGRHVPYKGLYYLIEAIKYVKTSAVFLIGGSGPITQDLKTQAECLNNVYFIGRVPNEDLVAMYYAADIFAFPSITKNEAFGVVLAEAMYCNTPAVTFTINGSGVNWVNLHGHTGIEVENSNPKEFAIAIDQLLQDSELCVNLAANAHKRVAELFIEDKLVDKIIDLYK